MNIDIVNWSISLSVILLLVAIIKIFNMKHEKRILSGIQSFAREYNSKISIYDAWDRTLIGIDDKENYLLFFIRSASGTEVRQMIRLSEVKECRLIKTGRKEKYHEESVNITDRIELVFGFHNKQKQNVSLEFYNSEYDRLNLTGELQLAEKWRDLIMTILKNNQQWEKQARTLVKQNAEAVKAAEIQTAVPQPA